MKIPEQNAAHIHLVRFGLYAVGRLVRKRQDDLATSVRDSSLTIQSLGRAWEDASLATQQGYATRDAIDEDLDTLAQRIRQQLAARDLGADRKPPYTAIFPDGIDYYLSAPVAEQVQRYQLLLTRLEANLPETDAVRTELVPQVKNALEEYGRAVESLEALVNAETLAQDQLEAARSSWEKCIHDTYAALMTRYDKKKAESFFKRARRRGEKAEEPAKEADA